jgi:hypothetical protein
LGSESSASIPTGVATAQAGRNVDSRGALYVLNYGGSQATVSVFSSNGKSFMRSIHVGNPQYQRETVAIDRQGRLYIAPNVEGKALLDVYDQKGSHIIQSLKQRNGFYNVTVNSQGDVYTFCSGSKICEYAAITPGEKRQKLVRAIGLKALGATFGPLAVDAAGDLAVSNPNFVLIFPPTGTQPSLTIKTPAPQSLAVAFDSANNLYVGSLNPGADAVVTVYAPGSSNPLRTISGGFAFAGQLAFDNAGELFVLNDCGDDCGSTQPSVTVFAPDSQQPTRIVTQAISNPYGMTVLPSGRLYVANNTGSVSIYAPGKTKPQTRVNTNIDQPVAVVASQ